MGRFKTRRILMSQIISLLTQLCLGVFKTRRNRCRTVEGRKLHVASTTLYTVYNKKSTGLLYYSMQKGMFICIYEYNTCTLYFVYCLYRTFKLSSWSKIGTNKINLSNVQNHNKTHYTFLARKWRPLTKAQSPTQKTRRCMTWHCADWPCCPPGLKGSWNWSVEQQVDLLF